MIDMHSHVLPHMDDGSGSVQESLELLRQLKEQGIRRVCATSHFYSEENSPEEYLKRRTAAAGELKAAMPAGFPSLRLGAEVYYFNGISQSSEIEALRLEGTELLLLEMPFQPWTNQMVAEVCRLNSRTGIQVLLAHVERYMRWQSGNTWDALLANRVLTQCNAEYFLHWRTRRKALRLLQAGRVHFIGSDCHNLKARPPKIGAALKAVGEEGRRILEQNTARYVPELGGAKN